MSQCYTNFPVFKDSHCELFKEIEDFHSYVLKNPQHELKMKYFRSGYFSTEHIFEDGLIINQVWKLNNVDYQDLHKEVGVIKTLGELIYLKKQGLILLIHSDIWEYSKKREEVGDYQQEISNYRRETLEYQVKNPSTIPDFLFTILANEINNWLLFEQYLRNKEKVGE